MLGPVEDSTSTELTEGRGFPQPGKPSRGKETPDVQVALSSPAAQAEPVSPGWAPQPIPIRDYADVKLLR